MIIGILKEVKSNEYRVAAIPSTVQEMVKRGHSVFIETNAGIGSGYTDEEYKAAGAKIDDKKTVAKNAELIYKVKEIFPEEYEYCTEGKIIFTYFHSNAHLEMTQAMLKNKIIGVAYEDVNDKEGKFPMLAPCRRWQERADF